MSIRKKGVTALSMLLVCMAVLSACSSKGADNKTGDPAPAGSTANSDSGGKESGSKGASGPWSDYPGLQTAAAYAKAHPYDKQMKITVFNSGSFHPGAPIPEQDEDPERQMLETAVNIDLEMSAPQSAEAMTKLNALAASGDLPDLIFFGSKQDAVQYFDQGLIADIGPYVQDYPNLVNRFAASNWTDLKYKGATLGTPGYDLVSGITGWWIRNDWLKKLNLQAPQTTDELLQVMKAFTTGDPDGNGQADTYGFVAGVNKDGTLNGLGWDAFLWMFGVNPQNLATTDGKLTSNSTDPAMKAALSFANEVVSANVVDPDWVSINDGKALDQKMYKGKDGILVGDWRRMEPDAQDAMKQIGGEVPEWIQMAPPEGPSGEQVLSQLSAQNNLWAISAKAAADPEKVKRILSMLDYWYADKDSYPYFAYGLKDIFWDDENGQPKKKTVSQDIQTKYEYVFHYMLPRSANDAAYFNYQNETTAANHELNMKYVIPNPYTPFVSPDPSDTLYADRQKYINEELLKFMTGKESLNNWDGYVETLGSTFKMDQYLDYATLQLQDQGVLDK